MLLLLAKENKHIFFLWNQNLKEKTALKCKQNFINPRQQRKPQKAEITGKKRETYNFSCVLCVNRINEQILRDLLSLIILSLTHPRHNSADRVFNKKMRKTVLSSFSACKMLKKIRISSFYSKVKKLQIMLRLIDVKS